MVFPARAMNRVFVCLAVCSTLAGVTSCTIVHHGAGGGAENDSAQKAAANAEFDAKGFVQANWATKVVPELTRDAVDVRAVVAALKADQGAAEKQDPVAARTKPRCSTSSSRATRSSSRSTPPRPSG